MTFSHALGQGILMAAISLIVGSLIFWPLILAFVFPGTWPFFIILFVLWLAMIGWIFDEGRILDRI